MKSQFEMSVLFASWVFILAVTAVDVSFAWSHRETFQEWEMNPVARFLADQTGFLSVVSLRVATVLFGLALIPLTTTLFRRVSTGAILSPHIYLFYTYAALVQ